jgi:phosphotriesterase-related protein
MRDMRRRDVLKMAGFGAVALGLRGSLPAAPAFPKGAIIRTILKDVRPETLAGGATLFHEHMSLGQDFMPRWMAQAARTAGRAPSQAPAAPAGTFFMEDLDLMTGEMKAAAQDGVACLVDGGHADMGRSLDFLKKLSTNSGMPIVAGAGFYTDPFYPADVRTWSEEQIAEDLIRQATTQPVGVFGEIGSWDEITDTERKVFRAVARAHRATNLSIFTHTGIPGKSAMEQLDILEGGGVKPERIVIGHLGNLVDPDVKVQKEICKRGAFIGFDRQGGAGDARQVPMVLALIEAGYAGNLMFSSDLSTQNQLKSKGGGGYGKTVTVWGKKLSEAGVKKETLDAILNDNPRRFLAFVPKHKRAA